MPKVSIKKSDGIKFKALATGVVYVHDDTPYVKIGETNARDLEQEIQVSVHDVDMWVSPATRIHVEY